MKSLRILFLVVFFSVLSLTAFAQESTSANTMSITVVKDNKIGEALQEMQGAEVLKSDTVNNRLTSISYGLTAFGAAFGIGLAAFGCALGMGKAASASYEGVSRNPSAGPRLMTMLVIGLALIESLAIYSFLIAIFVLGKI